MTFPDYVAAGEAPENECLPVVWHAYWSLMCDPFSQATAQGLPEGALGYAEVDWSQINVIVQVER